MPSKYIVPSPAPIVSTDSRTTIASSRRLDRHHISPRRQSCGWGSWRAVFAVAVACFLALGASGCGSGVSELLDGKLVVSPGTINFGTVPVGQKAESNINFLNNTTSPAAISQVSVSGKTFSVVSTTGSAPVTIPAGGTYTLKAGFTPVSTGDYSGQVTLTGVQGETVAQVPMQGQGSASQSAAQLTVSASSLNFGSVTVTTATTQSLTLTSTGTSPVTVNSASITGAGFSLVGGSGLPVTLSPSQSMTLQVQYDPTSAGAGSGQITISSNSSSASTAVVALSGTGIPAGTPPPTTPPSNPPPPTTPSSDPELSVSAGSLSFGSVTVDSPTTQSLTLTSTGTAAVTVNSAVITGAGFTIVGGSLPTTLNPTQAVTLQVQYDPTATGPASGEITISSNSSSNATTVVTLSGTSTAAPSPQLSVSVARLNFGSVTVNSPTTQSLTLTSSGTSPVTVNSAAITGAGFTIIGSSLPLTLSPTQSVTLQVQFDPTATGPASGEITISSNSSTGGTTAVTLSGTSTAAASPQLSVSVARLNFGSVTVNSPTTQSLTLTSTGTSPVTVNSAAITGAGFTIIGSSLPVTLSPTQSVTLQVQFDPTATGPASGEITISSDSSTGGTAAVTLSGTSTADVSPQLSVSTASLSFGSVTVGSPTTQSVTLTSTGTSPVTVNSAAITGTGFTFVGGVALPVTLNPSQSVTLQVQFDPTVVGPASGAITISSNSSTGATPVVTLSGTSTAATSPQLSLSAGQLNFGSVTVKSPTTQSLTLTSTGTSPVTVNSAAITGAGFTIVGGGSLPTILNPAQTMTLQVQFDPTAAGPASGAITISSNSSTGGTTVVTLSGTSTAAASPQLLVSTGSLSFGSVTVGSPTTQALILTSTGTSPVTVDSAAITGAGFTVVSGSLPTTLSPTQSVTLQIQFEPTVVGAASGQITITSNSTTGGTALVGLSGTGAAVASPQLSVSAASLNFGSVAVNSPTTQSLTLTSTGTSPVTVNSATITGAGFTIVALSLPVTLNPTQSVTFQVQFDPTAAVAGSGQIIISSNSTGGTALVALNGTGAAPNPQLSVSTASLSFGSVAENTATTLSLTLTSTGTSPVTVNSAAITGAGFTIVGGGFPVTLNPTQTLAVQVKFDPTTTGALTGQLTVSSNSTGGAASVALSGTGTAVAHQVDLSWDAPTSSADPVAGYNIYRLTGTAPFALINPSPNPSLTYVDTAVTSGTTYSYEVKAVDSSGVESVPSNEITLAIP